MFHGRWEVNLDLVHSHFILLGWDSIIFIVLSFETGTEYLAMSGLKLNMDQVNLELRDISLSLYPEYVNQRHVSLMQAICYN